jgi:tRNA(adenine34) deaminase
MCMGALLQARVGRLVFGCFDAKAGACGSLFDLSQDKRLNHRIEVLPRVLEKECSEQLSGFFTKLRKQRKIEKGA